MINLNKRYVAELGFQLVTPGSAVCHASGSFIEPSYVEINHEKNSTVILPFSADSRRAVVSYWQKFVHKVLINCFEDQNCE